MKRSSMVLLVFSGALLTGCDSADEFSSWDQSQTYTNNYYVAGRGYYHAPYHAWYPLPYNYRDPARGYFHGGNYTVGPHISSITESRPTAVRGTGTSALSPVRRGGFTVHRSIAS